MTLRELIEKAIEPSHEPYTVEEVAAELASERSTLFVEGESILICQLINHNDAITGHCWLGAGDMETIKSELIPRAEAWAKANGATRATIDGRRGWVRALKDMGFKEESVTLGKVLS